MQTAQQKMQIEIWSDIACPFCYIGKRNFERALEQFPQRDKVTVIWRSFQLMPEATSLQGKDALQALADHLHVSREQAAVMNQRVTDMARQAGLTYNMDRLVWANTFQAHRLIQYARTVGKADELEERLFEAHFTNGRDIGDTATLAELALAAGLDREQVTAVLSSDRFTAEVMEDIAVFNQLGLRGVPSFVANRSSAFSGAVPPSDMLRALTQAWQQLERDHPVSDTTQGAACSPGKECQ